MTRIAPMPAKMPETWGEMADFLESPEFHGWTRRDQTTFLALVVGLYKRQFPDSPKAIQLSLLAAQYAQLAREEETRHATA